MLLHLDASARRASSFSRELSALYAESWRASHPDKGYLYRATSASRT
ncbi:hypothetical protein ACFOY2_48205 [Nonomuraea purpurea]|uniref:Uncharacterized protein n=1 Tax=Nonomuraea purpurea TaxID=1849276 RepID=A0ABV8GQC9_9ACTN